MASIKLTGDTSGEITISAPAVAGTNTITLPAVTGNVLTDGAALPAIDGSALTGISSYSDSDALTLFNASGSAPVYACRAWVNFNGTGTVAIRSSGNVSSITDNGTGDYTVNFTTAMPDANYAVSGIPSKDNTTGYLMRSINVIDNFAPTTSYCRVCVDYAGNTSNFDVPYVMLQFFR